MTFLSAALLVMGMVSSASALPVNITYATMGCQSVRNRCPSD